MGSQRCSHALITSSTSCILSGLSCIGMLVRAWKRESLVRLVKISQPSRKITKRSELRRQRARVKRKATVMNSEGGCPPKQCSEDAFIQQYSISSDRHESARSCLMLICSSLAHPTTVHV